MLLQYLQLISIYLMQISGIDTLPVINIHFLISNIRSNIYLKLSLV